MTVEELLERYLANLDKALGLVDDTDDLSLSNNFIIQKLDIYNRISKLMDMVQKEIDIHKSETESVRDF